MFSKFIRQTTANTSLLQHITTDHRQLYLELPHRCCSTPGRWWWQGVIAMTAAQYFTAFWAHCPSVAELAESLIAAAEEEGGSRTAGRASMGPAVSAYPAHLAPGATEADLASGELLQVRCCSAFMQVFVALSLLPVSARRRRRTGVKNSTGCNLGTGSSALHAHARVVSSLRALRFVEYICVQTKHVFLCIITKSVCGAVICSQDIKLHLYRSTTSHFGSM